MDELNAGHQNLKAGKENGLKWDASRWFFRTIGLIQVYPLLHHDFPPISMANFNGHSMVDGFEVPQISNQPIRWSPAIHQGRAKKKAALLKKGQMQTPLNVIPFSASCKSAD